MCSYGASLGPSLVRALLADVALGLGIVFLAGAGLLASVRVLSARVGALFVLVVGLALAPRNSMLLGVVLESTGVGVAALAAAALAVAVRIGAVVGVPLLAIPSPAGWRPVRWVRVA